MSTVTEKAREEADRVEAEEAEEAEAEEETPGPQPESPPEPEPEATAVPVDPEKIERAQKNYMSAMAKAFGDYADQLTPCSRCSGEILGFEPSQPPLELKRAPDKETCPMCDGMTMFESGAKLGEFVTVSCTRCNGKGYIDKPLEVAPIANVYQYTPAPVGPPYPGHGIAFVPIQGGTPDMHGRPAGHPHYGLPSEHSATAGIA